MNVSGSRHTHQPLPEGLLNRRTELLLVALLLLLGACLLLYKFPSVPVGLQQDEISEAYESYSLLRTGADRWGYHLPIYFLSWGSGQNVLQAYLTIPVVAILGLTPISARLVTLLGGLFTLPLLYITARRWYGVRTALIALLFLALSPWHIMISRWGLENSLVPFFLLFGIYAFGKAIDTRSALWIVPSFVPFSLALYTYGSTVVVAPVLIFLLLFVGWPSVRARLSAWFTALSVFFALSLPIFFFSLKNYAPRFRHNFAFERWLPFTVPLLPVSRLSQVAAEADTSHYSLLHLNIRFLMLGMTDGTPWSQITGIGAVQSIVYSFGVVAVVDLFVDVVRKRRLHDPFFAWLIACAPMLLVLPMSISHAIAFYLPWIVLGAVGATRLYCRLSRPAYRVAFVVVCAGLFLKPAVHFVHSYYGSKYRDAIAWDFNAEFPVALAHAQQLAPAEPMYVSEHIHLNYMYTLFYTRTDPAMFQRSGASYAHPDFGPYRFSRTTLATTPTPYTFITKGDEPSPCAAPADTKKIGWFSVGECR